MSFLLDTNAVIALLERDANFLELLRERTPSEFAIPSVAAHELYYGAREAGRLRAQLAASGSPSGPYDVLIAGQANAGNMVLLSRNVREFERIPGLRLEGWA
jgi:tRNA(fMet)-specific endonuclease VapC